MTAFNVVRVRVKAGREQEFLEANRIARTDFAGFKRFVLVKTGDRAYCIIGEWDSIQSLAAARPKMIAGENPIRLRGINSIRDKSEEAGP